MTKYRITYRDCGEIMTMTIKAYDYEDAEEKFWESIVDYQGECYGIDILTITQKS